MRFTSRGAFAPKRVLSEVAGTVPTASKRSLALCFAPLALLGLASAGAAVTRHTSAGKPPVLVTPVPESAMNRTTVGRRACGVANTFLQRVLGNQMMVASATVLGDHPMGSATRVGALSVLCETSEGRYLMLVNAKTRQVYALNHVEETRLDMDLRQSDEAAGEGVASGEDAAGEESALMTRDTARGQALRYLSLIGMPTQNLTTLPNPYPRKPWPGKSSEVRTYNFAFTDSRHPAQPVMVTVNGKSGQLQRLWRPVQDI